MKGVIFDFDGVLVDTAEKLKDLYFEIVIRLGGSRNESDFSRLNGANLKEICQFIKDVYTSQFSVDEILSIYQDSLKILYDGLVVKPEVVRLIDDLKQQDIKLSIGSSCPTQYINLVLKNNGLDQKFEQVVGGDLVERGKPHPDIFLKVLRESSFHEALVIDDSGKGIEAALRANCIAILYDENVINSRVSLTEFVSHALSNKLSYLGKFSHLDLVPAREEITLSKKELDQWNRLLGKGSFSEPLLLLEDVKYLENNELSVSYIQSEYKYYRVSKVMPIAIAVTGFIQSNNDSILLAKRSNEVHQRKGEFDLVPSGGLQRPEVEAQLNSEWLEESGLENTFQWEDTYGVFIDHKNRVIDLVKRSISSEISLEDAGSTECVNFQYYSEFPKNKISSLAVLMDYIYRR